MVSFFVELVLIPIKQQLVTLKVLCATAIHIPLGYPDVDNKFLLLKRP